MLAATLATLTGALAGATTTLATHHRIVVAARVAAVLTGVAAVLARGTTTLATHHVVAARIATVLAATSLAVLATAVLASSGHIVGIVGSHVVHLLYL